MKYPDGGKFWKGQMPPSSTARMPMSPPKGMEAPGTRMMGQPSPAAPKLRGLARAASVAKGVAKGLATAGLAPTLGMGMAVGAAGRGIARRIKKARMGL